MFKCENCLWYGQCSSTYPCEDYSPIEVDIDRFIEDGRRSFHEEWNEYMLQSED